MSVSDTHYFNKKKPASYIKLDFLQDYSQKIEIKNSDMTLKKSKILPHFMYSLIYAKSKNISKWL